MTRKLQHNGVVCCAFSPDASRLATVGYDQGKESMRVWSTKTLDCVHTLEIPVGEDEDHVNNIVYDPADEFIVTTRGRTICIWEEDFLYVRQRIGQDAGNNWDESQEALGFIKHVALSQDGKYLAASEQQRSAVCVWQRVELPLPLPLPRPDFFCFRKGKCCHAPPPWKFEQKHFLATSSIVESIAFAPTDKDFLISLTSPNALTVWQVSTGKEEQKIELSNDVKDVAHVAVSHNGLCLAVADSKLICLYNWKGNHYSSVANAVFENVVHVPMWVRHVTFTPNDKCVVVTFVTAYKVFVPVDIVRFFDVETGQTIKEICPNDYALVLSPDATTCARIAQFGGNDIVVQSLVDWRRFNSAAIPLLAVGFAPYLALDIVDFLIADKKNTFGGESKFMHFQKMRAVARAHALVRLLQRNADIKRQIVVNNERLIELHQEMQVARMKQSAGHRLRRVKSF